MLHIYLNHTNDTQMRKQKMILDNTNPHAHKSYEIKEGINGEGKIIHLVNTLVDSSIVSGTLLFYYSVYKLGKLSV